MSRSLASHLMNRGRGREREFGRALARGRVRMSPDLATVIDLADKISKDFAGAPTGAQTADPGVYTPTPGGPPGKPKHNERTAVRKTRLNLPYGPAS